MTKLIEILQKYPGFGVAGPSENQEILDFFNSIPMKGDGLDLSYERSPDFFKFLSFNPGKYIVFTARDNDNKLIGVATVIIRDGYILNQKQKVGYLGDLRALPNRRLAVHWRKFYEEIILKSEQIEEFEGVKYFYTCILDDNSQGKNTLVNSKRNQFKYTKMNHYKMINIFGRVFKSALNHYEFSIYQDSDFDNVQNFIDTQRELSPFRFNKDEWHLRFNRWDKYHKENFIIIKKDNIIVGVCGLWSPTPHKKIILKKVPLLFNLFLKFSHFILKLPSEGEELKPLYLTNLTIHTKHKDSINELLNYIINNKLKNNFHMLSICDFDISNYNQFIKGFIKMETPLTLYRVDPKSRDIESFTAEPDFEMSLI